MEKVQGIGGVFFRARDPVALGAWYRDHLGIDLAPRDIEMTPWVADGGVCVFAPFSAETDYFAADRVFMLNFRVRDLEKMLTQLEAAGVAASHRQDMEGVGRFARVHDPEGNPLELWEPAAG